MKYSVLLSAPIAVDVISKNWTGLVREKTEIAADSIVVVGESAHACAILGHAERDLDDWFENRTANDRAARKMYNPRILRIGGWTYCDDERHPHC